MAVLRHDDERQIRPLIEDPAWVRDRYVEAKELLAEVRVAGKRVPTDLWLRIDDFYVETFLDTCTTLGPDCGCNT